MKRAFTSFPFTAHLRAGFLAIVLSSALPSYSQLPAFDCGSNGSYGPMNITANTTLQLPPDGIFHCTTVNIAPTATLKFYSNALNTPVYILATDLVIIDGILDVSGQPPLGGTSFAGGVSGPGGFAGGSGSQISTGGGGPGDGPGGGVGGKNTGGPGTGTAGPGSYRTAGSPFETTPPAGSAGSVYGNSLLIPLVGGSGGGGEGQSATARGGGGGGGAILIASNARIAANGNSAQILARGGQLIPSASGGGSGGAVRMVTPMITGSFGVNVSGGQTSNTTGGKGRFRIDATDTTGLTFRADSPDAVGKVMTVFPNPLPKLSVSSAAGTAIPDDATSPVAINLPIGTSPNQTITVRARDFGTVVPIQVRLVPENGDPITCAASIDNTVTNPAEVTVSVVMPVNTGVSVQAFTR